MAMESAAKKCITWGIVLILAGGLVLLVFPSLLGLLAESTGPTAAIGVGAIDAVLNFIRWALIPMGTTLIGAAVVIRVLAPALTQPSETRTPGG